MSSIVGFSSGNSECVVTQRRLSDGLTQYTFHNRRQMRDVNWKVWYLINLICFLRENICNYIHLLLVIHPTRCAFEMMEHRRLLHMRICQIYVAQLYLILFYSHSTNQPKCFREWFSVCFGFRRFQKVSIKRQLNQIISLTIRWEIKRATFAVHRSTLNYRKYGCREMNACEWNI